MCYYFVSLFIYYFCQNSILSLLSHIKHSKPPQPALTGEKIQLDFLFNIAYSQGSIVYVRKYIAYFEAQN